MLRRNINNVGLFDKEGGPLRKHEFIREPLENGTFLPNTVLLEDIDKSFKEWVKSLEITSDDGTLFPTMSLYSNQRFSEYMQSWQYTDANNNLLLNFKTVSRNNNPSFGDIQSGNYNIPGDKFFHMRNQIVMNDNGIESMLKLSMKQPTALDIVFKLSIFTTNFKYINEFNMMINRLFNSRQVYINPNGYYMPMILDSINDESQYNIDDRQFYSQTFDIKVKAFIITEDDFRVDEIPMKVRDTFTPKTSDSSNTVEIEEFEGEGYISMGVVVVRFNSPLIESTKFTIDTNLTVERVESTNLRKNIKYYVNGSLVNEIEGVNLKNGDEIKVVVKKKCMKKKGLLKIYGTIS
jgi:hypothetical protein